MASKHDPLLPQLDRDVTAPKGAEEALRRERDFISAMLDTAGALVVVLDRQGRIVRFNRACETMTGYSFDEARGQLLWDLLLVPEEVEPVRAVFEHLRAGQFPNKFENYWLTKDGSRQPSPAETAEPLATGRELEVLRLVAKGRSNKEIADELVITELTVRTHVSNILGKLQLASRTQAALYALKEGLTSLDDVATPGEL